MVRNSSNKRHGFFQWFAFFPPMCFCFPGKSRKARVYRTVLYCTLLDWYWESTGSQKELERLVVPNTPRTTTYRSAPIAQAYRGCHTHITQSSCP